MAVLTLRSVKGSPLTNQELDGNFSNVNNEVTAINSSVSTINSNVGVLSNLTTASNANLVSAVNTLVSNIGSLSSLTTENKSNIVFAINNVRANVGPLSSLTTINKSNIVFAINEVQSSGVANVGVLFNLSTPLTSNLVSAVNSVNSRINSEVGSIGLLSTLVASNVVAAINSLRSEYSSNVGIASNLLTNTKANVVSAVNELVGRLSIIGVTGGYNYITDVEILNSTWSGNTIAISRGGTGQTTALGAFNAFSPLTTLGDVLIHNGTNNIRLAGSIAATKRFLTQTGTGSVSDTPSWGVVDNSDVPSALSGKTYNGLSLAASSVGFTIAGGTTSKTLTINNTIGLSGTDTATLNIGSGGTLGSAAFTSSSAYAVTGGTNATGTWPISISGTAATATTASSVAWTNVSGRPTAVSAFSNDSGYITSAGRAYPRRSDGSDINFYWSGQSGQPPWLWGGSDGANMYVYNPSNFSVNYATSAGSASTAYGLNVHTGRNNEADKVVRTDSSGHLLTGYINSSNGDEGNAANPSRVWGTNGADSYLRTYLTSSMSVNYATSAGTASSASSVAWTNVSGRPTNVSAFSNDSGYVTSSGSVNYATSAGTANSLNTGNNYQVNSLGIGTAASGTTGEIRATGDITAYYSDIRLKEVLGHVVNALDKISSLTGFYYQANETAQALGYKPVRDIGLSAQDVQAILPEAVVPAPIDDRYLTVRYEKLIPVIVEAIKELSVRLKALEVK